MQRSFYPKAGDTLIAELGFFARAVRVQSGQNYIYFPDTGDTILPGTTGAVVALPKAHSIASAQVTGGPSTTPTLTGPVQQTQAVLQWTDSVLAASPGVQQPTTQGTQTITLPSGDGGTPQVVNRGLARWLSILVVNESATTTLTVTIQGIVAGTLENLQPQVILATKSGVNQNSWTWFAGQGSPSFQTGAGAGPVSGIPLCDSYRIVTNGPTVPYNAEIRYTF